MLSTKYIFVIMNRVRIECYLCLVDDFNKARRKAKMAEQTSDLDTVSSDTEKQVSRKKRARNWLSDDDDVEPTDCPPKKSSRVVPKKGLLTPPPVPQSFTANSVVSTPTSTNSTVTVGTDWLSDDDVEPADCPPMKSSHVVPKKGLLTPSTVTQSLTVNTAVSMPTNSTVSVGTPSTASTTQHVPVTPSLPRDRTSNKGMINSDST